MSTPVTAFTPWASLLGGGMIGLAAVLLMLSLGRIMGATGILSGLMIPPARGERGWRAAFVCGMVLGPLAVAVVTGRMPAVTVPVTTPLLILGGVIVGIGVSIGSGCTSGHGVCGNARLSPRSMVATATFLAVAGLTTYLLRHVVGV